MTTIDDEPVTLPGAVASADIVAAEVAVVGAAMRARSTADELSAILRAEDFADNRCRLVFEAMTSLLDNGHPTDPAAVLGELGRRNLLGVIDGVSLFNLVERAPVPSEARYFARKVAADAVRRRLHVALLQGQRVTSRFDFEPASDLDVIRKLIDDAAARVVGDEPQQVGDLLGGVLDRLEAPHSSDTVVRPPYIDLERLISGLRPGQLAVVAARPSVGKSLVALDFARAAAVRDGQTTLMFSMEMTYDEVIHRLLAAEATVELQRFVKHELDDRDWERIARVHDKVMAAPLFIDDHAQCSLARIRSQLRTMKRRHDIRLVIIDYLGLLEMPRAESRERSVAQTTRTLKVLAAEFGVPILLVAQLNRASEHRAERKPMMSDLRESGAIEADAHVVILLHREDYYEKESPRAGEIDLIVDKNRSGPTATITAAFQGHYGRIMDMADDKRFPPPDYVDTSEPRSERN
jgi:replicative DNA helicase